MIRKCEPADAEEIYDVINDAAVAYRDVISPDCWHEPYMSREELSRECASGVVFSGFFDGAHLAAVMGLQLVGDVALVRHAYTRTASQRRGLGAQLLTHVRRQTDRPMLIGTWKAATWAVRFYEREGFRLVHGEDKDALLRRYWTVPDRQIDESVVLADARWFSRMSSHEKPLDVVPYDPGWPAAFDAEAIRLRASLGAQALRIDHHGSTSIPGLGGKPIIDIQISVAALQPLAAYGEPLERIGYVHVPDPDDAFCPFFHRPAQWPHTHHVHVVEAGGTEERRTLAFRDYLRDHADEAREYERLKRDLARQLAPADREAREAYARAKTDFIERIVAMALRSGYPRPLAEAPPGGARNLVFDPKGYWVAGGHEPLSYPDAGHDLCFAIEDGSFWFRHRNDAIVAVVRRFPPGGAIFDIGGGNGYVAAGLERAGFSTVLVEPGQAGAENARRRGLRHVICASVEAAGFAPGTMHAAGMFDVLEHIRDDRAFLGSLRPLLRPDGRLYLSVPAFPFLWSSEDTFAGHFRRYTRGSLAGVLEAAGFDVEYMTYLFWFLPLPVWLLRAIPSRLGWRGTPTLQSASREHAAGGVAERLIEWALSGELARIARGRTLPFGGSCLAVARRAGRDAEARST